MPPLEPVRSEPQHDHTDSTREQSQSNSEPIRSDRVLASPADNEQSRKEEP